MKLSVLQSDVVWENRAANFEKADRFAGRAKDAGAGLLVLPEMFATGFSFKTDFTAEPPDGETPAFLRALAAKYDLAVVGGYVRTQTDENPHNVALAVDGRGRDIASYSKVHLFSYSGEDKVHGGGDGPKTFEVGGLRAACFICYDLRFPELFRETADACDLMIVIASWPARRQMHWDVLLRARAVENQCYVVGVNRVGQGGGLEYSGGSVIIDPWGNILANAADRETLLTTEIEADTVKEIRAAFPFLKDRR